MLEPLSEKIPASKPLKLDKLLDYWLLGMFLLAVAQLLFVRGLDQGTLIVFLLPPSMAMVARAASPRRSTRVFAALFLTAVDLGEVVALFPSWSLRFQHDSRLSPHANAVLGWYLLMYLLFVFCLFPPFLFGRGLVDKHRGCKDGFSRFTCILGLIAWLIMAPTMFWVVGKNIGFWPKL